jgi:geranyl-CoA carboxylase alpha subunit
MAQISSLLIANRGEIACRIMRTARELGIRTIAVYSDADAQAPHVHMADDAVHIGASPVGESYLRIDAIIAAAKASGADAIHPGYGFLSENAAFSRACADAGISFVGPPEKAIAVMGDKARSKRAMIAAGVPCIPGYQDEDQSDARLIGEAAAIGFPLMVKAAAGGGGRGMRLVHDAAQVADAIAAARSEALNAFGNGELILEKAILRPRHVEIQIFGDSHGNIIHLGERDCSVQRRHQKVIEEAPCPVMTPQLRAKMGAAAIQAARAVDYIGAGTVEFLLDNAGDFYFLEMNTRLQVEHPVTEAVTGRDLVALQLQVAQGEPLGLTQDDIMLSGHAIEVRLYAEDPASGFLPATGPVLAWQPPGDIRVDAGIASGGAVSPFYDAMVAKLVAHGPTREVARARLVRALQQSALLGVANNRDFLISALGQPDFISGAATTGFIADYYGEGAVDLGEPSAADVAAAAVLLHRARQQEHRAQAVSVNAELLDWASTGALQSVFQFGQSGEDSDGPMSVHVHAFGGGHYRVTVGDQSIAAALLSVAGNHARLAIDGRRIDAIFYHQGRDIWTALPHRQFLLSDTTGLGQALDSGGGGIVTAPMHGQLLSILVAAGQAVAKGEQLAVLEAMKMQHQILAETDGTVSQIAAQAGSQIAAGDLILEIAPAASAQEE